MQTIVETHSDYVVDHVRTAIRLQTNGVTRHDARLLYFERDGGGVAIRPIGFDDDGNLTGAPATYRRWEVETRDRFLDFDEPARTW